LSFRAALCRPLRDHGAQSRGGLALPRCALLLLFAAMPLRLALLGGVLGFLPWNFNPAVIFLGDCGSLLIGYLLVVIILLLGEQGQTHLVFAGLIIFSLPIMDTSLAILRRKLAGVSMSQADANHIHHLAKRALGGGVLLELSHEFDYLTHLFGRFDRVFCVTGRSGLLEIDVEDRADILLTRADGLVAQLHMDFLQRKATRRCKVIGEHGNRLETAYDAF
jgi:small basic protein